MMLIKQDIVNVRLNDANTFCVWHVDFIGLPANVQQLEKEAHTAINRTPNIQELSFGCLWDQNNVIIMVSVKTIPSTHKANKGTAIGSENARNSSGSEMQSSRCEVEPKYFWHRKQSCESEQNEKAKMLLRVIHKTKIKSKNLQVFIHYVCSLWLLVASLLGT